MEVSLSRDLTSSSRHNARQVARNRGHRIAMMISIGTGKPRPISRVDFRGFIRFGLQRITDPELAHQAVKSIVSYDKTHSTFYRRFSVDKGISHIRLDEWKTKRSRQISLLAPRSSPARQNTDASIAVNTPFLMDRHRDYVSRGILKRGYQYPTLETLENETRRYISRRMSQPNLPAIAPDMYASAGQLAIRAQSRREVDIDRWSYFTGNFRENIYSNVPLNYETSLSST